MPKMEYDREKAIQYARKWAKSRNPAYYDYDKLGGDCTSFVSQCIYAGSGVMNYNKKNGWYYIGPNNHSPSWTAVGFLYNYLTRKAGIGPIGRIVDIKDVQPGDVSQFQGASSGGFSHTQLIVSTGLQRSLNNVLIAAHTIDSLDRPLSTYNFQKIRFIHIYGIHK